MFLEVPVNKKKYEVAPFFVQDTLRGYMFDGVVYATREQAESAKEDREARTVDGVLYATREQADEERARKEDLKARTVDGVLYATKEQAESIRAEIEETAACTVEGVRYANRELAAQVRADLKASRTFNGVEYYSPEAAERARQADKETRSVDGVEYTTREEAETARKKKREEEERIRAEKLDREARTVDGVLYDTTEKAEKVRSEKKKAKTKSNAIVLAFGAIALGLIIYILPSSMPPKGRQTQNANDTQSSFVKTPYASPKAPTASTPPVNPAQNAPTANTPPSIDWNSPYAQGYNHTGSSNSILETPGGDNKANLNPNIRVDILEQRKDINDTDGKLYYKVSYKENGNIVTGWTFAEWMTVLPTGRQIPDTTPVPEKTVVYSTLLPGNERVVVTLRLNVRDWHDAKAEQLFTLEQGERVTVLDRWSADDARVPWYKVRSASGNVGWTYGRYLARWNLTDDEYREFMKDADYAAADKAMANAYTYVKSKLNTKQANKLVAEQKAWIMSDRSRTAELIATADEDDVSESVFSRKSKRGCFRLATIQRLEELYSKIESQLPIISKEHYSDTGGNDSMDLDIKWLDREKRVALIEILNIMGSSGHTAEYRGIGVASAKGRILVSTLNYEEGKYGVLTVTFKGRNAEVDNDPALKDYCCGANACLWGVYTKR